MLFDYNVDQAYLSPPGLSTLMADCSVVSLQKEDTTKTRAPSQLDESRGENPVVLPVPVTLPTVAT